MLNRDYAEMLQCLKQILGGSIFTQIQDLGKSGHPNKQR
jgi:hypothetical protein